MKYLTKSNIGPIVSALFLVITFVTGHHFSKDVVDNVDIIILAVGILFYNIWGIVTNHRKEDAKPTVQTVATEASEVATAIKTAADTVVEAVNTPVEQVVSTQEQPQQTQNQ